MLQTTLDEETADSLRERSPSISARSFLAATCYINKTPDRLETGSASLLFIDELIGFISYHCG